MHEQIIDSLSTITGAAHLLKINKTITNYSKPPKSKPIKKNVKLPDFSRQNQACLSLLQVLLFYSQTLLFPELHLQSRYQI